MEVLELALDLRDGASAVQNASPQKLDDARRVRESLAGMQAPGGKKCYVAYVSIGRQLVCSVLTYSTPGILRAISTVEGRSSLYYFHANVEKVYHDLSRSKIAFRFLPIDQRTNYFFLSSVLYICLRVVPFFFLFLVFPIFPVSLFFLVFFLPPFFRFIFFRFIFFFVFFCPFPCFHLFFALCVLGAREGEEMVKISSRISESFSIRATHE